MQERMLEKVRCPHCDKMVTRQGLGGHIFGKHMIRTGASAEMVRLAEESKRLDEESKRLGLVVTRAMARLGVHKWHPEDEPTARAIEEILSGRA